jgi:hypothetical protein
MNTIIILALHDSAMIGPPTGYPYIVAPLIKSANSPCNIGKFLPGGDFPNKDYALDNLIPVILHELVEVIISPVPPGGYTAMADECANEPGMYN